MRRRAHGGVQGRADACRHACSGFRVAARCERRGRFRPAFAVSGFSGVRRARRTFHRRLRLLPGGRTPSSRVSDACCAAMAPPCALRPPAARGAGEAHRSAIRRALLRRAGSHTDAEFVRLAGDAARGGAFGGAPPSAMERACLGARRRFSRGARQKRASPPAAMSMRRAGLTSLAMEHTTKRMIMLSWR